ncbi:MAG: hypothetical protein IJK98_06785, partial [Clostridia bacterium]|nr:hypothetical protein [Clostridia bacterium]
MKNDSFKRIVCLFAAVLLPVFGALTALAAAEEVSGGRVVVYDAPEGFDVRDDYAVEVRAGGEWLSVPVFSALVTRGRKTCTETFFASVDLEGTMQVRVTPKRPFANAEIRPFSDGIKGTAENGALCFAVDHPCQLSVEFDGDVMHNLQLFVNGIL